MMRYKYVGLILGAFFISACQLVEQTQPLDEEYLAGGWHKTALDEPIKLAANFAIKKLALAELKIVEISDTRSQIVAGKNYSFIMLLSNNSKYQIVVFQDLTDQYQLLECNKIN